MRDSKRPLRSHCIGSNASLSKGGGPRSGGGIVTAFLECFSAATVTTLNQQRKPLRHDFVVPPPLIVEALLLPFLFFGCGMRDSKIPLFALQYKNSPQIITVCGVIFMPNYFLGTILSLPPIYIRSASGIETVPSALRLFSRNAISILGGATTVLLRV